MSRTPSKVTSIWRYPVKSMLGEGLDDTEVTENGLLGDRAYALIDDVDGKAATAKNPKKWPTLFGFQAGFVEAPRRGAGVPAVRITMPDGSTASSQQADCDRILSKTLGRAVKLRRAAPAQAVSSEEYRPDLEGDASRGTVADFALPKGTFFDCAMVHLLTTASLDMLQELYPQGRFDLARFRPNLVVSSPMGAKGFVENDWVGRTLAIGDSVRLHVTKPTGRCVMTTLAQGHLPRDLGILRTVAKHNHANVGVYATIERGGTIRRGDAVQVE